MNSSGSATKVLIIVFDYLMVLTGLAILGGAFFKNWNLAPEMIAVVSGVIGVFSKCIADFHAYEFSSSRASQAKDAVIATELASRITPPNITPSP